MHALPSLHSRAVRLRRCGFEHVPVPGLHVSGDVALIAGGADHRVRAGAGARLTRVGLRARVAVVASRAVRLRSGCEQVPVAGIAVPGDVALIAGGADHRVRADARARLTGVGLRARVAVGASRAVRASAWLRAGACRGVARSGDRGTDRWRCRSPGSSRCTCPTDTCRSACTRRRRCKPCRSPSALRIRAGARPRVARPGVVALVAGGADHRVRAGARARLTGVGLRARVAVVASRAVRASAWLRASACRGVADSGDVALIAGGADHRVRAGARARLTRVGLRAGVAVVASRAVRLRRCGFEQVPVPGLHVPATWH